MANGLATELHRAGYTNIHHATYEEASRILWPVIIKPLEIEKLFTNSMVVELRKSLKLSQQLFAEICGIKESLLKKIETNRIEIPAVLNKFLYVLYKNPASISCLYDEIDPRPDCFKNKK